MDFEAPVDAWYVWIGVALVATGLLGVAMSLPSEPPPDASGAVNTIDEVAGNPYPAHAIVKLDATEVRIGLQEVSLRNDAGTTRATVRYGPMTPVDAITGEANRRAVSRILEGESPSHAVEAIDGVESQGQLRAAALEAHRSMESGDSQWRHADGTLRVRKVFFDEKPVLFVDW